jgi:hypothetical protein
VVHAAGTAGTAAAAAATAARNIGPLRKTAPQGMVVLLIHGPRLR